jgi:hypothetical protein
VSSFEIGRSEGGSEYYMGVIDEVRIYNRALGPEELNAVMNIAAGGTDAGSAARISVLDEASGDAVVTPTETPDMNIQLGQQFYLQGETLSASSFWISNPSTQSHRVEVKTWIELPGLQPIPLDMVESDVLTLSPGFSRDYGLMPLLKIAPDSPAGDGQVNGRLIDPVTGDALSQDINPFTITSAKSNRTKTRSVVQPAPQVALESYEDGGRIQYLISNTGTVPAAIEFKAWLEAPGVNPVALLSSGADGSFVLPVGAEITVDPLAAISPDPEYTLKARILDPASGEIFSEK